MTEEQRQLIQRATQGDKDALGDLLEIFGPEVESRLKIDVRWRGSLDSADVMQVTYIEAFAHIRNFDPDRADSFSAWLRRLAENNLRDAIRALEVRKDAAPRLKLDAHSNNSSVALLNVLTSGHATPSRIVRQDEASQRLLQAMQCLPTDYRRTVQLYDLDGRSVEEVAADLKRSTGAVYMLRSRAHDRLRELLGETSQNIESKS